MLRLEVQCLGSPIFLYAYNFSSYAVTCGLGPWYKLPLTVRWLCPELKGNVDFLPEKQPPVHMPIVYGKVRSVHLKSKKKLKGKKGSTQDEDLDVSMGEELLCGLCVETVPVIDQVQCLSVRLAQYILQIN